MENAQRAPPELHTSSAPYQFDIRGWYEMHPLDGPAWSLFFEYIANLLYALSLRKLSQRWLGVLTVAAAGLLVHMLVTRQGDAIGGWSLSVPQLHIGFARLLFPFLAGMLLMRSGWRPRMQHSFLVCSVLLVGSMALPRFGGLEHLWVNGLYESFCILVLFPVIVALGAGAGRLLAQIRFAEFLAIFLTPCTSPTTRWSTFTLRGCGVDHTTSCSARVGAFSCGAQLCSSPTVA